MAHYEVHIPAGPGGFNTTLKVQADNWMAALKAGLQKLGEQGAASQNVMVDIQDDNSIHVTDSNSGRVFRIRELTAEEAARATVKRTSIITQKPADADKTLVPGSVTTPVADKDKTLVGAPFDPSKTAPMQPAPAEPPPAEAKTAELPKAEEKSDSKKKKKDKKAAAAAAQETAPVRPPVKSSPRVDVGQVEELEQPLKPVAGTIGRPKTTPEQAAALRQSVDDMLSDVFLQVAEIQSKATIEEAMEFVLDLAMSKVPCEAGSVLRSDGATADLTFVAARGPKAAAILKEKLKLPAGVGFAGFCAAEGVSVAVSDAVKDKRYYPDIGEKVDFTTKSILCAPMMTHGRSFGCMQLINRKGADNFLPHEVGVLAYLSHQAALYLNSHL